ncbi:efflux RND transporter periplasmic adaptor subunit [Ruegeria pomeroyi]|nr:efflux RND transporter periplasmic adaptor subunit [Ruegeria pomeroyi]MCE8534634.1 efflux RND transporter periplasmic adaptor subunit [Ruegeria pomeroyi]
MESQQSHRKCSGTSEKHLQIQWLNCHFILGAKASRAWERENMRLNHIRALIILLLCTHPAFVSAQEASGAARPAKVHTVVSNETFFERVYPALVYPSREVEMSFRVSGRVLDLPIRASDRVAEGDIIAKLDTRDFEAQVLQLQSQRDQAAAQLSVLRSGARPEEISALEASVAAAEAQRNQARDEYERTRQLVERGVTSAAQLEQREAAYRVAEAELSSRREQLTIGRIGGRPEEILAAEASIRGIDAQLQVAQDSLSDATLRAPFSGTIARRNIENFAIVSAGEPIALLQDLSTLEVGFDLPSADLVAITAAGLQNVSSLVVFDAMPGVEVEGELVEFSTQADAATQTYRGRLLVKAPEGKIVLPGMVARVIARATPENDANLTVPVSAVASGPDGSPFVWRVDAADNTVARQPVELGEISPDGVVVLAGLEAGSQVVSAGLSGLQDGMAIRPVTKIGE